MEGNFEAIDGAAAVSGIYESIHAMFGNTLSDEMIQESITRTCDFFHIDEPAGIVHGGSVGVYTLNPDIVSDDVMVFNREELFSLGISDKDSLDLIMTHEGAHRMLQDIEAELTPHQEELCCDFMSGICAELNDIDVDALKSSLAGFEVSETHPDGHSRIAAIEDGMEFAREYMDEHGIPPTWTEAYEHFNGDSMGETAAAHSEYVNPASEDVASSTNEDFMQHYDRIIERQEADNRDGHEDFKQGYDRMVEEELSFRGAPQINDRKYYERKAETDLAEAKFQEKLARRCLDAGQTDLYNSHMRSAKIYHESAKKNLDLAKKCTQ